MRRSRRDPGWLVPVGISLAIIAWGQLLLAAIGSKPRAWSYTNVPYVPGQSFYATESPGRGPVPNQVELPRFPGGVP
ncbi:MAG: hypothetical protein HY321_21165 [Armatimonadetes bacterium]|nr:hypothetical protein [Armatimonadota bacterium]